MKRYLAPIITLVLLAAAPYAEDAMIDVWLDVDPAAGLFQKDVDDALAMIQTFHSPRLRVQGLSVVYGNAPLDKGVVIAREVIELFGPEGLKVHPGASEAGQLGEETDAVRAMAEAFEGKAMTLLALGPLTNVGSLLRLHPELESKIERIVVVAGRRPGQIFRYDEDSTQSFPDFNFDNDPAAMQVILNTSIPLIMAPWEVSSHIWLRSSDMETLASSGEAGAWIAEKSRSWLGMWKNNFGTDGFNPFDTLAVAWLTHPELIESEEVTVWMEQAETSPESPDTPEQWFLHAQRLEDKGRIAIYCARPKPELKAILLRQLSGEDANR